MWNLYALKRGPHKAECALWGEEKSENRWNILQRIWNIVFCTSTICAQQTAKYWRKSLKGFFDKLKAPLERAVLFNATQACKPGSVLTAIYLALQLLAGSSRLLGTAGSAICPSTALLRDRVYSVKPMLPWAGQAMNLPFHLSCLRSSISLLHLS